jgi:hypothetical protein
MEPQHCRTIIGRDDFDVICIEEYQSPEDFLSIDSPALQNARLAAFRNGFCVPMKPGWFRLNLSPPAPSRPIMVFNKNNVWSTPGGLVGPAARGARVGETSSSQVQAENFVSDNNLGQETTSTTLWHLNLLRFKAGDGLDM